VSISDGYLLLDFLGGVKDFSTFFDDFLGGSRVLLTDLGSASTSSKKPNDFYCLAV